MAERRSGAQIVEPRALVTEDQESRRVVVRQTMLQLLEILLDTAVNGTLLEHSAAIDAARRCATACGRGG